jgi:hypothetical protein
MTSNCIIEAFRAWRADEWRGNICMRISRCGRMVHVYYERYDGEIVNFLPPPDVPRKRFAPPFFRGVSVNHDVAWHCHVTLLEWGVDKKLLRRMTDDEVMTLYQMERRGRCD